MASTGTQSLKFYTVDIDSYIANGSASLAGLGTQAFFDTGTTLNSLPTDVAKAYNAKFVPPATFDQASNEYFVDCNAIAPTLGVTIGGSTFTIDGKDQILPRTDASGNTICKSGTQDGGDPSNPRAIFIL